MDDDRQAKSAALRAKSHMPETVFYEKMIPALLIFLALVLLGLIIFGFVVMLGYFNF